MTKAQRRARRLGNMIRRMRGHAVWDSVQQRYVADESPTARSLVPRINKLAADVKLPEKWNVSQIG